MAWYPCDHLGTPQEVTDGKGEIAWAAACRAWGVAKEAIRKASGHAPVTNPIRFQGQCHDHETGLHYNRYRYYDPEVGRFISKDPIGYAGGVNVYQYAPNPVSWIDPWGLACSGTSGETSATARGRQAHKNYRNALPGTHEFEFTLPSGKRIDAIDWSTNTIRELKPNNTRAIRKGKNQVAGYVAELEKMTGQKWTGIVDTYQP